MVSFGYVMCKTIFQNSTLFGHYEENVDKKLLTAFDLMFLLTSCLPNIFQSDNGTEFVNQLVVKLIEKEWRGKKIFNKYFG
jgi:hypothetical protein